METNFEELKKLIKLNINRLVFIGGRPATGKSTLGINLANSIASENEKVILFNFETSKENINASQNVKVIDTPNMTINDIKEQCILEKQNLKLIVIDYLQLIKCEMNIYQKLKELSQELNITIIVLSQLTRKIEERENRTPVITDVKEEVTENFDVILFLDNNRKIILAK